MVTSNLGTWQGNETMASIQWRQLAAKIVAELERIGSVTIGRGTEITVTKLGAIRSINRIMKAEQKAMRRSIEGECEQSF